MPPRPDNVECGFGKRLHGTGGNNRYDQERATVYAHERAVQQFAAAVTGQTGDAPASSARPWS